MYIIITVNLFKDLAWGLIERRYGFVHMLMLYSSVEACWVINVVGNKSNEVQVHAPTKKNRTSMMPAVS